MPADAVRLPDPFGGAYVSCPIFDTAGLALQPPQGGFPYAPSGLRFRAPVGLVFGLRH